MKIQLLLLSILLTFIAQYSSAQNIDYKKFKDKKNIVTVNDIDYAKIVDEDFNMSIYGLDGENELVYIKYMSFANSDHHCYYIVRFLDFEQEAEIRSVSIKGILRKLYNAEVIEGNKIDEVKMKKFVYKYGTDESSNRSLVSREIQTK
jgi:hypothetical protein